MWGPKQGKIVILSCFDEKHCKFQGGYESWPMRNLLVYKDKL